MPNEAECFVCGETGPVSEGPIRRTAVAAQADSFREIAQCPVCGRFLCTRHVEWLDLGAKHRRGKRDNREFTSCCPFDPGIPLGKAGG
jgi:hypothetical protein